jgi:hypothetical protein
MEVHFVFEAAGTIPVLPKRALLLPLSVGNSILPRRMQCELCFTGAACAIIAVLT